MDDTCNTENGKLAWAMQERFESMTEPTASGHDYCDAPNVSQLTDYKTGYVGTMVEKNNYSIRIALKLLVPSVI